MKLRAAFAVLLSCAVLAGCSPSDEEVRYHAQKALLERQNRGLTELIAEQTAGNLVPQDKFLLGIDESVVGDLFRLELPIEKPLGKGFMIRLEDADVQFKDKFGVIDVKGVLFREKTPDRQTAVVVHGGLGAVEIDPKTGVLHIKIAVDDIEVQKAGILDKVLGNAGKRLIAQKGRELLADQLPSLQVPVSLAQEIRVPPIKEGAVQMDSLSIPLNVAVDKVFAGKQKLWVTFDAKVGTISGAESGLGVSVGKKGKKT